MVTSCLVLFLALDLYMLLKIKNLKIMTKELQVEVNQNDSTKKTAKLVLSILFDLIGTISYIFPGAAEIIDVVWAPVSGLLLTKMYKGNVGKIAGVFGFLEEILPGTDLIPTFTITWFYTYVINKNK